MMGIEGWKLVATSAVVSAIVGGLITYLTQNRLLARKAQLDYDFEAKRRLRETIGPLRLQLLLAARHVVRRYSLHHERRWNMSPQEYYVKSCIYRLLAPIAIGQLIERQMSIVDFTVDQDALDLLTFVTASEKMLTGHEIVIGHPKADWSSQSQHLFGDNLRAASQKLIKSESGQRDRLMTFAEFDQQYQLSESGPLGALVKIFGKCKVNLTENPIFWIRVVGFSFVCAERLKSRAGLALRFSVPELQIDDMVRATEDEFFITHLDSFKDRLGVALSEGF